MSETAPRRHDGGRGFTVLALAGIAVLLGLGTWQLDRLRWKEALIAERSAAYALPPVRLTGSPAEEEVAAWRRVTLTGAYLYGREVLVGPRAYRGSPGWHAVTPLRIADGRIVLVDRGWVPKDLATDPAGRDRLRLPTPVTVEGIVKRPSAPGRFAPPNVPSKEQWFRVDPAAMAGHLGLSGVPPWWVEAVARAGDPDYPAGTAGFVLPVNHHLQYAMTWYSLAAALAVIAVLRVRAQRRADNA
jgi:surfeit locus 1 family protein